MEFMATKILKAKAFYFIIFYVFSFKKSSWKEHLVTSSTKVLYMVIFMVPLKSMLGTKVLSMDYF